MCRPNIYTMVGELYTVDCEDCKNTTNEEHATDAAAIAAWNEEQEAMRLETYGDGGQTPADFA